MARDPEHTSWAGIGRWPLSVQWALLVGLSAGFCVVLTWAGLPAALLLSPMIAGILVTTSGGRPRIPAGAFSLAQGVVGCMIAKILPLSISGEVVGDWPLFAAGVVFVIAASGLLGWLMARLRLLPGSTVVWGLSPGGASAMIVMAESYGADTQLVALMQYLRVVMVAALASAVTHFSGVGALHEVHAVTWFPTVDWPSFAGTLALAILGPLVAGRLRMPAGGMLLPLIGGVILVHAGWLTIELPQWLLAISYALIGWRIGLRFTRQLLIHAAQSLPRMIACTLVLIAACGALAAFFVVTAGVDPLTAYLATSPGGADSVAILAASSNVDAPFVMTMQMARMVVTLMLGPAMAKFIATRSGIA
ncbi:MAG TPA: AbrB family transcriptional regulator [Roseomonas sp.]|jgi:hypothetical protein